MYNAGEAFSTIVRRGFVAAAASSKRSLLSKLLGSDSDYIDSLGKITEFTRLQVEDPAGALEIYESLPESIQQLPEILSMRIQAASLIDEDVYLRALLDFAKFHPDSPALALMMIDVHILRDDHKKALANVDVIDGLVLGDPYLEIMRGSILRGAGDLKKAKERVDRGVRRDPGLGYQALWEYLEIAIVGDDHAETLRCLLALENEHGIDWSDLSEVEVYASFLASDSGKAWLER